MYGTLNKHAASLSYCNLTNEVNFYVSMSSLPYYLLLIKDTPPESEAGDSSVESDHEMDFSQDDPFAAVYGNAQVQFHI